MELKSTENNNKTVYMLQLAQNFFQNTDADVYKRIRDFVRNYEYDFQEKKGIYIISSIEELKKDLQIHLIRKNDKELNLKIQYYFGIFMLVGLGVYAIGEIIDYYADK